MYSFLTAQCCYCLSSKLTGSSTLAKTKWNFFNLRWMKLSRDLTFKLKGFHYNAHLFNLDCQDWDRSTKKHPCPTCSLNTSVIFRALKSRHSMGKWKVKQNRRSFIRIMIFLVIFIPEHPSHFISVHSSLLPRGLGTEVCSTECIWKGFSLVHGVENIKRRMKTARLMIQTLRWNKIFRFYEIVVWSNM